MLERIMARIVEAGRGEDCSLRHRERGEHRPDSDLDLLVIKESKGPGWREMASIYHSLVGLSLGVDKDIVVYTSEEVERWRNASLHFVTTALREGKVLYERKQ